MWIHPTRSKFVDVTYDLASNSSPTHSDSEQTFVPTKGDLDGRPCVPMIEESSALHSPSDSYMVEVSPANAEGVATSSASGSSGGDSADADAVERQLLDPLSLQIGGGDAKQDTQTMSCVSVDVYTCYALAHTTSFARLSWSTKAVDKRHLFLS